MDAEAESLTHWAKLIKILVFAGAAAAVLWWRWLQRRTMQQINSYADDSKDNTNER